MPGLVPHAWGQALRALCPTLSLVVSRRWYSGGSPSACSTRSLLALTYTCPTTEPDLLVSRSDAVGLRLPEAANPPLAVLTAAFLAHVHLLHHRVLTFGTLPIWITTELL